MAMAEALLMGMFWLCFGLIFWTYGGYMIALLARSSYLRRRPRQAAPDTAQLAVTAVLAVRNGARWLPRRIANLLEQDYPEDRLKVLIVCNGCEDESEWIAREWASRDARVRVLVSPAAEGKAGALNAGVAAAENDVVVFADVRQRFEADAVAHLVRAVQEPGVGAVTGRLVVSGSEQTAAQGLARYWRYETRLRMAESATGSVVGVTGAIYALWRRSYQPVPAGTLLDDVFIPLKIALAGERVAMEPRAVAWDEPAETGGLEYRRRVRMLAGNIQLLRLIPELLRPNNPMFGRFLSHKILRVLSPLLFLGLFFTGVWLGGVFYSLVAVLVALLCGAGGIGLLVRHRLLAVPSAFVLVHVAALEAMIRRRRAAADLWIG